MKIFISICLTIFSFNFFGQDIDSLKLKLASAGSDSLKAVILNELTANASEDEWEIYNAQLSILVEKNLRNCKTVSLFNFYKMQSATVLANSGYIAMEKGLSDKAIEFYLKALKIYEQYNVIDEIATINSNIGFVYQQQKESRLALKYFQKAWHIYSSTGNKFGIATSLNNMAYIYKTQENYKEAIKLYLNSIKLYEALKDNDGIAASLNNLGLAYRETGDTANSIICYKRSSVLFELGQDNDGLLYCYNNIGNLLKSQNNFKDAAVYAKKSFELTKNGANPSAIYASADLNYHVFKNAKKFEEALEMYELKIKMRDSVSNEKNHISILQQQHIYNQEKEQLKHEKELAISESQKQKSKLVAISIIGVLLIVIVFSVWVFIKFKQTQKQKNIISIQSAGLREQKLLLEEKQKEISDSINYAKRIQTSFLANKMEFDKHFSEYFIHFAPKDVVSGDFYWTCSADSKLFVCVADSTGHGIPGAFMSLLNISLLNEAVLSRNYTSTVDIINFVRRILILGLKPDDSGQGGNDGMDCSLFSIDFNTMEMEFSGANNPLWIVRNRAIIELKTDKMPVGRSPKEFVSFTSQKFQMQKGDLIYGFTDGYADQFGGPKGKKFKYKQLEELLLSVSNESMEIQKQTLNDVFETWKGNLEQVDDVCIIGIRI